MSTHPFPRWAPLSHETSTELELQAEDNRRGREAVAVWVGYRYAYDPDVWGAYASVLSGRPYSWTPRRRA